MPHETQLSLFKQIHQDALSIKDSAAIAGVSTATIRNWVKTGYLEYAGRGMVTNHSFERFQEEVAGKGKLNQRANKSKKCSHDHNEIVSLYLNKIENSTNALENIGTEYEQRLSDSYRNKEGIYYTPKHIVDDLFCSGYPITGATKFCDPCCGSGNFIMRALSLGVKVENIFGFDTDPVAVSLTKKRIFEETGILNDNIKIADFLGAFSGIPEKFDLIFTNPPWGKKADRKYREKIGSAVNAGTSIDTCSLFFFACLNVLAEGGMLGMLLPEAFFNIALFEEARKRALDYRIERLTDYKKPFASLLTKAQAITLRKTTGAPENLIACERVDGTSTRTAASFEGNPKSILNFSCSSQEAETISFVFSIPHVTLKNKAAWGLGIVTGNNGKFIKDIPCDGFMPVIKGSDITTAGLKNPSCYISSDLSLYQQVAPVDIYTRKSKIIYRFISSRLCFAHDTKQRFVLNSANILIPNDDFPVRMPVLCDLMNSDFMNWVFSKMFSTHKILRTDLEYLPIHSQFLTGEPFIEDEYIGALGVEKGEDGSFRIKG